MMLRRSAFQQVGGMDESFFMYFEEIDLCRRLRSAGWRVVHFPDLRVRHLGQGSAVHPKAPVAQQLAAQEHYFRKHGRRGAASLLRLAMPAVAAWKMAVFGLVGLLKPERRAQARTKSAYWGAVFEVALLRLARGGERQWEAR